MRKALLGMLLIIMALQGVGHTAHQSGLYPGLGLTMTQPTGAVPVTGGWMNNWFNPGFFPTASATGGWLNSWFNPSIF
jgi:hypothetical protein